MPLFSGMDLTTVSQASVREESSEGMRVGGSGLPGYVEEEEGIEETAVSNAINVSIFSCL